MSADYSKTARRAREREAAGDAEGALSVYDEALAQHPDAMPLWSARGLLLERMQRLEDALDSFRRSVEAEETATDRYNAGNMLLHMARHDEAIAQFDRALELEQDPRFHVNRGFSLHALARFPGGVGKNFHGGHPQKRCR